MTHAGAWLALAAAVSAQAGSWKPVEPPQAGDARIVLSLDRPAYLLGETVVLDVCVENVSTRPFSIEIGSDYRGGSRATRFKVIVTSAAGAVMPDPDPSGFNMGGLGSLPDIAPGGRFCQSLLLMRYARIDAPGTYTVRATHDLGWKSTKPPEGHATFAIAQPTTEQAERVVAEALRRPSEDRMSGDFRIVTPRRDLSVLRYPIYLPGLMQLADEGDASVVVAIGAIPTPEATRTLIRLMHHRDDTVAVGAARQLALRLPDPALDGRLPGRGPFGNELEDPRRYLRDAGWRPELAADVRAIAGWWLVSDDPSRVIQAAFTIQAVGTASDGPALAASLARALERTLTLPFEKGGYPRPRGAMQELMRAADVMISRGYTPPARPATPGEAALWLTSFGKGVRPAGWPDVMRDLLAHRIPYVRELALKHLPDDAPADMLGSVGPALQHADMDLRIAALEVIRRLKLIAFVDQVTEILKTAREAMFLNFARNALSATAGTVAVLDIMAARLTEPEMFAEAMPTLLNALQVSGWGSGGALSAEAIQELAKRWTTFLDKHRAEIDGGKRFAVDDPAVAGLIPAGWNVRPSGK